MDQSHVPDTRLSMSMNSLPPEDNMSIGQYQLLHKIGKGGMGVVYKATDIGLQRTVAVKFLLSESGNAIKRFLRETEVTARFDHPHIVKVYHVGEYNKLPYLVMEFVDGLPLLDYIAQNQCDLSAKLQLVEKVACALDYAHRQKVVHRDVKPSNIMVRRDGSPVLMDFGIAKVTQVNDHSFTRTGEIVGTLEYMAPEQALGMRRMIDEQTDIYGLGAVLYHLLVGHPPVTGQEFMAAIYQIINEKPLPPRSALAGIPEEVENICLKALEKEKSARYRSCQQMLMDIQSYRQGRRTVSGQFYRRRRLTRILAAGLLILTSLAVFGQWQRWRPAPASSPMPSPYIAEDASGDYQRIFGQYKKGQDLLAKSPQEACLYLEQAYQFVEKYKQQTTRKVAAKDSLDAKQHEELLALSAHIPALLVQAAFAAESYADAYRWGQSVLGQPATKDNLPMLWNVVRAAYHCGFIEECAAGLSKLESCLEPVATEQAQEMKAQIPCYQGLVCFARQHFAQARNLLSSCLGTAEQWQDRRSRILLYLHYCAVNLIDLDTALQQGDRQRIAVYLDRLSIDCGQPPYADNQDIQNLFLETKARHLLDTATATAEDKRAPLLAEVIAITERLLRSGEEKAVWYYMQGKSYMMAKRYQDASRVIDLACEMEPGLLGVMLAKSDLLWMSPRARDMHSYMQFLPTSIFRGFKTEINLFAREFNELKRDCLARAQIARGIPFSGQRCREYVEQYCGKSQHVRAVAATALCAMVPHISTKQELSRLLASHPQPEILAELTAAIHAREQEERRQKSLQRLVKLPMQGKLVGMHCFDAGEVAFLQEMLASDADPMLRFLAARVLAQMPDVHVRQDLHARYLSAPVALHDLGQLANRIIVARALMDTGYIYTLADPQFAASLWQQINFKQKLTLAGKPLSNEFLCVLLVEILSPYDSDALQILQWLLERHIASDDERGQLAVLARLSGDNNPVYSLLKQTVLRLLGSNNLDTQAFLLATVAAHIENTEKNWMWATLEVEELLTSNITNRLCEKMKSPHPLLRRALLAFWRRAAKHLFLKKSVEAQQIQQAIREAIRPLWLDADPKLRYQAILTSSELWDREVLEKTAFNVQEPMLARFCALFPALQSRSQESDLIWYGQQAMRHKLLLEKEWRMSIIFIYLLGRQGRGMLSDRILQSLDHAHPVVRFVAAVSSAYLPKISPAFRKRLRQMAENDPESYVRPAAWAALLHHAEIERTPEAQEIHQYMKAYRGDNWQEYRQAAVWAYGIPWEPVNARAQEWEPEQVAENLQAEFVNQARMLTSPQPFFDRLHKSLDMLSDVPDGAMYEDVSYLLCLLHEGCQQHEQAVAILNRMLQRLGERDTRFLDKWSHILLERNQTSGVAQLLQSKQQAFQRSDRPTLVYAAMLQRNLHRLSLHQGKPDTVSLNVQYMLMPRQNISLGLLGEYFFRQQQYDHALAIFCESFRRMPRFEYNHLWLARVYAMQKDPLSPVYVMHHLHFCYGHLTWAQLRASLPYDELLPIVDNPKFRQEWDRNNDRKND